MNLIDEFEPTFTTTEAENLVNELYGIEGIAKSLAGYEDLNFKIKGSSGDNYLLKISRANPVESALSFQEALLRHLDTKAFLKPQLLANKDGEYKSILSASDGSVRIVRLLTWMEGRTWNSVNPITETLLTDLGEKAGEITNGLRDFKHNYSVREYEWDTANSLWVKEYLHFFDKDKRAILSYFIDLFEARKDDYDQLRKSIVHNDVNDHNIIVSDELVDPKISAIIDYGDATHTQIINDLAITCCYAGMGFNDPLAAVLPIVKGYHSKFSIEENEIKHLYTAMAMRLAISLTKSAQNKLSDPDNEYLQVSDGPGWDLLRKWYLISPEFALYRFREACGYEPHPKAGQFKEWAETQKVTLNELFPELGWSNCKHLDLSIESTWLGHYRDVDNLDLFDYKLLQVQNQFPQHVLAGGYMETRPLYSSDEYDTEANAGKVSRTVHIGVDFWLPAGTAVHALYDGEIVMAANDEGYKEYGGFIVLKHQEADIVFYTLHGHLSLSSLDNKTIGQKISKGDCIGYLGNRDENGYWSPHLHFQILLSTLHYTDDFPGVAYQTELDSWRSICPDPNLLFKLDALRQQTSLEKKELIKYRKAHLGKSLSLHYKNPLKIVRGNGAFLVDHLGDKYLDTVNNVAHVGHENYKVVKAGQEQMALLNTNSRYLHENINKLSAKLLSTLPDELSVVHFVNSGSEANELAYRMAKAASSSKDVIVSEVGYHGNTNVCVDISSYKFDGKGGSGKADYVHVFPLPDAYRGKYRAEDATAGYLKELELILTSLSEQDKRPAALILESIISCGGQIELPNGFLKSAYEKVRAAGGVCIADEVQTGCGRVGHVYWAFQLHDVVPDIVTIGKPLGNGHPVAAVVCTQVVAESFANGMEFFNTFGGNPVSCAIASSVLDVIESEDLQSHARQLGDYFKAQLEEVAQDYPIIGDVRGQGLFLGFELVDQALNPLAEQADYLINRLKYFKVLSSTDGKDHNVIKIKPPMVIEKKHVDLFIKYLRRILSEDFMQCD